MGVSGCAGVGKEKFDLMRGGGGDKNQSLEALGLRSLALKNIQTVGYKGTRTVYIWGSTNFSHTTF